MMGVKGKPGRLSLKAYMHSRHARQISLEAAQVLDHMMTPADRRFAADVFRYRGTVTFHMTFGAVPVNCAV